MANRQTVPQQAYGNQAQLTLVTWCLLKFRDAKSVSYEKDDDIAVESQGGKKTFIQVKSGKTNPLQNGSIDLWKTILNWTNQCSVGENEEFIFLITRNHTPGQFLKSIDKFQNDKDYDKLHAELYQIYINTKNEDIKSIIKIYLYAKSKLIHVFSRVKIEVTPDIQTYISVRNELSTYNEFPDILDRLASELMVWVQRRIEEQSILNSKDIVINKEEFAAHHANKRRSLIENIKYNLIPPQITDEQKEELSRNVFIQQLDAIKAGNVVKDKAVTDFLTAQKYLEDMIYAGTIIDEDISEEKSNLKGYWQNIIIAPSVFNAEQRGAEVYSQCMNYRSSPLYLKSLKCELCNGTYHMLADEVEVWWHPDFKSLHGV